MTWHCLKLQLSGLQAAEEEGIPRALRAVGLDLWWSPGTPLPGGGYSFWLMIHGPLPSSSQLSWLEERIELNLRADEEIRALSTLQKEVPSVRFEFISGRAS